MIPETYLETVYSFWRETREETTCRITGNCMLPTIRESDTLVLTHDNKNIRRGDVVVFGRPGDLYVNRVVGIQRKAGTQFFLLKADQRARFHLPLTRDRIMGRVTEVRGTGRNICLDRAFWRYLNYLISLYSYVQGRRSEAGTSAWSAVNRLFALLRRALPPKLTPGLILRKVVLPLHRPHSCIIGDKKRRYRPHEYR